MGDGIIKLSQVESMTRKSSLFRIGGKNSPLRWLLILTVPVTQFLLLRIYLHSWLGMRIGYLHITDYDWVCPSVLAFLLLMFGLEQSAPIPLGFRLKSCLGNIILFFGFALFNTFFPGLFLQSGLGVKCLWFLAAFVTLASAAFWFVSPQVFTIVVCPEISSPGAWPVCSVVTPKPRTHSTSFSRAL